MQEDIYYKKEVERQNIRAVKNNKIGNLTQEQANVALEYFDKRCAYSWEKFRKYKKTEKNKYANNMSLEHVIPLVAGGHSIAFNCIPAVINYNVSKGGAHLLDWWKTEKYRNGKMIYHPYKLLKVVNYMLKAIQIYSYNQNKSFRELILEEKNEIDIFLKNKKEEIYNKTQKSNPNNIKTNIKLGLTENIRREKIDFYKFIVEAIEILKIDLQNEILDKKQVQELIKCLNKMYYKSRNIIVEENKKIYEKLEEEISIQREIIKWLEKNNIKNKYAIATYTDIEKLCKILKKEDINDFLNKQKKNILRKIGINNKYFSKLLNKVPTLLSNLNLEIDILSVKKILKLTSKKNEKGYSNLYTYIIKKPGLLLESESVKIISEKIDKYQTIKKQFLLTLEKNASINNFANNIITLENIIKISKIKTTTDIKRRIIDGVMDNVCFAISSSISNIYIKLQKEILDENSKLSEEKVKQKAAKWIIYLSQKRGLSILCYCSNIKNSLNKSRYEYENIEFDENGYMIGARSNKYLIPFIIKKADLNITVKAKKEIEMQLFNSSPIKGNNRIENIYLRFQEEIKKEKKKLNKAQIEKQAAIWIIYIIKNGSITAIFDSKDIKENQIKETKKLYGQMKLDRNGYVIGKRDNIYVLQILLKKANLKLEKNFKDKIKKEILNLQYIKHNGKLLDYLYEELKKEVRKDNPKFSELQIERRAARWIIYSKCQGTLNYLIKKSKMKEYIEKTRNIYNEMTLEESGYLIRKNVGLKEVDIDRKLFKIEEKYQEGDIKENHNFIQYLLEKSKLNLSNKEKAKIKNKILNNIKTKNQSLIYSKYINIVKEVIKENLECSIDKIIEYSCKRLIYIIKLGSYDLLFRKSGFEKQMENTKNIYKQILINEFGEIVSPKSNYIIIRKIADNSEMPKKKKIELVQELENLKKLREGNLIYNAYEELKCEIKKDNNSMSDIEIEKNLSKWIIYILKCSSINQLISSKTRQKIIGKTRNLYRNFLFDKNYEIIDITKNEYMVPLIVKKANLEIGNNAKKKIEEKLFQYKMLRNTRINTIYKRLQEEVKKEDTKNIEMKAARWLIYISYKGCLACLFSNKRYRKMIEKTRNSYKYMELDKEANIIDRNDNIYFIPKIVEMAKLDMPYNLKQKIVNDMFQKTIVKNNYRIYLIFEYLKKEIINENKKYQIEEVLIDAARWLIYIFKSENANINAMNILKKRKVQIEKTRNLYKNIEFDEKGNLIEPKKDINKIIYYILEKSELNKDKFIMIEDKLKNSWICKSVTRLESMFNILKNEVIGEKKAEKKAARWLIYIFLYENISSLYAKSTRKEIINITKNRYIKMNDNCEYIDFTENKNIIEYLVRKAKLDVDINKLNKKLLSSNKVTLNGHNVYSYYTTLKEELIQEKVSEKKLELEATKLLVYILKNCSIYAIFETKTKQKIIKKALYLYNVK